MERFDLFKLERYTGCISCFGCKKEKFKGHCICKDGLTPVLDAIRDADWPWTLFDPESKQKRHETVFPEECKRAYALGAEMVTS